ncbi:MAG: hypothetical protein OEZ02_04990 [Anaerolineae bacterium]|nr:hypothetical protein [Anaerolineae bacterium]
MNTMTVEEWGSFFIYIGGILFFIPEAKEKLSKYTKKLFNYFNQLRQKEKDLKDLSLSKRLNIYVSHIVIIAISLGISFFITNQINLYMHNPPTLIEDFEKYINSILNTDFSSFQSFWESRLISEGLGYLLFRGTIIPVFITVFIIDNNSIGDFFNSIKDRKATIKSYFWAIIIVSMIVIPFIQELFPSPYRIFLLDIYLLGLGAFSVVLLIFNLIILLPRVAESLLGISALYYGNESAKQFTVLLAVICWAIGGYLSFFHN